MRIDPKYFNLFIGICAVLTVVIIFYSTVRYSQNQVRDFENSLKEYNFSEVTLKSFTAQDSLHIGSLYLEKAPVIIHFWATWSGKSLEVDQFLSNYSESNPELIVIAAAVRDSEDYIREYISGKETSFLYVEGTSLYQTIKVPGMPTQILFQADGSLFSSHVGGQLKTLKQELDDLIEHGR